MNWSRSEIAFAVDETLLKLPMPNGKATIRAYYTLWNHSPFTDSDLLEYFTRIALEAVSGRYTESELLEDEMEIQVVRANGEVVINTLVQLDR